MENLTNVAEEVVTDVAEEVVTKIGVGTVLTGAFALTGVLATVYGAVKVGKWAYGKAKAAIDNKVDILEAGNQEVADAKKLDDEK